jgi:ketopantoate reductase
MKIRIAGSGAMGCRFGAALFDAGHEVLLLAGTTTLGTELVGPGHIRALGSGETVLGPVTPEGAAVAYLVGSALTAAGISTRVTDDALPVIWAKVAFNCVMNTLCAIGSTAPSRRERPSTASTRRPTPSSPRSSSFSKPPGRAASTASTPTSGSVQLVSLGA